MIIVSNKTGQLANRMFAFGHFIGYALAHQVPVLNLGFAEYQAFFPRLTQGLTPGLIRTRLSKSTVMDRVFMAGFQLLAAALWRLWRRSPVHEVWRIYDSHDRQNQDFDLAAVPLQAAHGKWLFTQGWLFRDRASFRAHSPAIRELFTLASAHQVAISRVLSACRAEADVIIGLHMRMGDYRTWQGGKYFYPAETYAAKARELVAELAEKGKRVIIVPCSNEPIDTTAFAGLRIQLPTGHFVEDLYLLAGCDYILGPPSTYSMWASFYGQTPLLHLASPEQPVTIDAFRVYTE